MKMVKTLLLGSAAGLVAVSGAQAADLPVKAKPVEYVKVCSLYGAGFYYVPGTDICLKIGAYVRAEYAYGNIGNSLTNLDASGADGQRNRLIGIASELCRRRQLRGQQHRECSSNRCGCVHDHCCTGR